MSADAETVLADAETMLPHGGTGGAASNATRTSSSSWPGSSGVLHSGRFEPGSVIAQRYRISGLLGRGGMGEVYRADDLRLGQTVALKFLPADLGRDAIRLAQFHTEVRTARHVSHPNVCRVYDIGELDGEMFLTMEYVDGEDLSSLLRRIGRLPEDKAVDIARQICAGLAAAHERGVIHRDLKPANIMLDGAGKVRIMDFSLASIGRPAEIREGTPAYMAPEQLHGRNVTVRSDIYSLGLVLYELFTGRRVFDVKTMAELVDRHVSGTIVPPTDVVKTLDPAIERCLLRCLDEDPSRRPQSALAVSASLPGGDPLAAALAAGETPSPEMVAAAGGVSATISGAAGVGLLALACALLVAIGIVSDRAAVVARVPLDKPREVLVDRAEELRQRLGYTARPADATSGFQFDERYLTWAARRGAGATDWRALSTGRPAAIRFWYRTSPAVLAPYNPLSAVTPADPPPLTAGMSHIDLDMQGRLLLFEAVPGPEEYAPGAASVDWTPLFEAAGLDRTRFSEVPGSVSPLGIGDEHKAWEETDASDARFRIDASGLHGRPTRFALSGEWQRGDSDATVRPNPYARTFAVLFLAAIPIGAAVLAHRNLKTGRGDRRGAFRSWAFAFGVTALGWVVSPTHVAGLQEVDRMFAVLGQVLFRTGQLYLTYLALEPYVRRTWPTALITWSRVLSGRVRDPLVGRDLVAGTLVGLFVVILTPLALVLAPQWLGWTESSLLNTTLAPLSGARSVLARVLVRPLNSMQDGMLLTLLLSLLRQALRKLAGLVPGGLGRVGGSDALLSVAAIALFLVLIKRDGFDAVHPAIDALVTAVIVACIVGVAFRLGLFALVCSIAAFGLTGEFGLTLDPSKRYAPGTWLVGAIFLTLIVIGVWLARAGQPFFAASADRAPLGNAGGG